MGLDLEYLKNQMYTSDLSKLNENELKYIIGLLEDEREKVNIDEADNDKHAYNIHGLYRV